MSTDTNLPRDYSLEEVAESLGMSTRWLRGRIKLDELEHLRYGHKIRFSSEQVDQIRARYTKGPDPQQPVTTGRKKRTA